VGYYRNLKSETGLPAQFDSLVQFVDQMPVLEKSVVRDNRQLFLAENAEPGNWQRTGGSTGTPTSVFWSKQAHLNNLRLRYEWLNQYDVEIFDSQAMLWGHGGSFAPGLKGFVARQRQPIEDWLRNRQRFSAYNVGPEDLDHYLQLLQSHRTKWLYGYSSAILLLANRAIETGAKVDCLKLVTMTGEPAMPKYADQVDKAFAAPARVEYGSVECGNIAHEFRNRKLEIHDSCRFVESINQGDGELDLLITVLDNPSFPLFRYQIGDTTSEQIIKPKSGRSCLVDVQGRNNDYFVRKDGGFVHSNAVKHAMENVPYVTRFHATQDLDGSIRMEVEFGNGSEEVASSQTRKRLQDLLGGVPVELKQVERIKGNLAGKHVWVKSKLFEKLKAEAAEKR